jgi:DNA-binding transcriptional LysR family regulator
VRPAVLELESADALIRSGRIVPQGRLRVNAPMTWGNAVLAPLIPRFLHQHPHIALELTLDDRLLDPIPPETDITLRIAAHRETALASESLGEIHRALYASKAYLERAGRPTAPSDLTCHACLHYGYLSTGSEWVLQRGSVIRRVKVAGTLASNSGMVLAAAALEGAGIAQLPSFIVGSSPLRKSLEVFLPQWGVPSLQLHAIVPPTRQVSGRVRSFCEFLRSSLQIP